MNLIANLFIRFLWVTFQLDELCEAYSDAMIRATLQNLPQGLIETYKRILNKISKHAKRITMVKKIFHWTACARRPLLIAELKEAIAFDTTDTSWDIEKIPTDENFIISACGNLVNLDDDKSIRFAHHTVQQFLIADLEDGISTHPFNFKLFKADVWVGQICITYLLFSDFETQITTSPPNIRLRQSGELDSEGIGMIPKLVGVGRSLIGLSSWLKGVGFQRRSPNIDYSDVLQVKPKTRPSPILKEKYSLLNYIAENWIWHTTSFKESTESWQKFKYLALEKECVFSFRPWDSDLSKGPETLPYLKLFEWAVRAGHEPFLRLLLNPRWGFKLDSYCNYEDLHQKNSALSMALYNSHAKVLELLLSVYKYDTSDGKILVEAAQRGQNIVVEILLRKGWNVNSQSDGRTALHEAARMGHEAIVVLLLRNAAAVNLQGPHGTPLLEAAEQGHTIIVNLLVANGADSYLKWEDYKYTIKRAVQYGHLSLVRELMPRMWRSGIFVSVISEALADAITNQHEDVAQFLLDSLASEKASLLKEVAKNGEPWLMRWLLSRSWPESTMQGDGWPALFEAVRNNDDRSISFLYQYYANKGVVGKRTELHKAATDGIVRLRPLLFGGIDVSRRDRLGRTPLHQAAINNHQESVQLLLDHGAYIDVTDCEGLTPLHGASILGYDSVVRLLLDNRAMINIVTTKGSSALHYAALNGRTRTARILLSYHINVNLEDGLGMTALDKAKKHKEDQLIILLA